MNAAAGRRPAPLLRSAALYAGGDLGLKLIGFFLIPLYTRALTPEDYGIIGFADALAQVLGPLLGLGMVGQLGALWFSYEGRERDRLVSTLANATLLWAGALTLIALVAGRPLLGRWIPQVPFHPYVELAVLAVFASTLYYLPLTVFNFEERPGSYTTYALGLALFATGASILLVLVLRLGALGALQARLAAGVVGVAVAVTLLRRRWQPAVDRAQMRAVLAISLPVLPHLLTGTVWRFADRFFLAGLATLADTGRYSLALQGSSALLVLMGGATTALNPVFYRRAAAQDPRLPADWADLSALFFYASAAAGLGIVLVGPDLLRWLTPASYHGAADLLLPLVAAQLATGLYWLFSPGIGHTRRTWAYPAASFPALASNLALNALLVPRYGAAGAAWALAASAALQGLIFAAASLRAFPVPLPWGRLARALVLLAVVWGLGTLTPGLGPAAGAAARLALGAAFPIGLLALGALTPSARAAARELLRERRRGPGRA